MKERTFKKHEVVFWQGDPGDCMFYIRWGSVGVYTNYATSKQKQLATLRAGDYFGEMGLLGNEPRSATIAILESGTILNRIDDEDFGEFLASNPARVHDILAQLSHKLRKTTKAYLEVCQAVRDVVGTDKDELDESTTYNFAQSDQLVAIHDQVEQSQS